MFVAPDQLLRSLMSELSAHFGETLSEASIGQCSTAAIRLLYNREVGGEALARERLVRLEALIHAVGDEAPGEGARRLAGILPDAAAKDRNPRAAFSATLSAFEALLGEGRLLESLNAESRRKAVRAIAQWETGDRQSITRTPGQDGAASDTSLDATRFEAYLRDRFGEPDMRVTDFRPLAGGFGKETILLTVSGRALDGPIVIRRDPIVATVDNDCHRVALEYPVIRAAFERGFPAPEALWVDTEHRLLPGADFLVMRMSPGRTGGNVFRSTEALSDSLMEVLGRGVGALHALPPLVELDNLTNSIRADLWDQPIGPVTRRYIEDWRSYFLANSHNPSPALMALYDWVLDNVPDAPGRPVLVHGDIGFHNMLIDEGRLSALVDWEFAHIGDPAEDMGSIRNVMSEAVWPDIVRHYIAAGGSEIAPDRLHFFRIWQHVRNASASNLAMGKFQSGEIPDLKLAYTGHYHFPLFIRAAWDLIEAGPEGAAVTVDY